MSAARKTPARVGRTLLLNPQAQENITRALRAGAHLKHAVESFGIDYSTAARWMADGVAHAEGRPSKAQRDNLGALWPLSATARLRALCGQCWLQNRQGRARP